MTVVRRSVMIENEKKERFFFNPDHCVSFEPVSSTTTSMKEQRSAFYGTEKTDNRIIIELEGNRTKIICFESAEAMHKEAIRVMEAINY